MLLTLLVALAIVIAVIVTYSAVFPFKPYELREYAVKPEVQCMGDVVQLYPTRVLEDGTFNVIVDPWWQNADNGEIIEAPISTTLDVQGTGNLDSERSQLAQEVPEKPGEWEHHVMVTIEGRVGVLPRKQEVYKQAKGNVTVLPNSDSRCANGGAIG